jgi:hypothetical protein
MVEINSRIGPPSFAPGLPVVLENLSRLRHRSTIEAIG